MHSTGFWVPWTVTASWPTSCARVGICHKVLCFRSPDQWPVAADRIPARLVLPVVVPTPEDQAVLGPYDLPARMVKPRRGQAFRPPSWRATRHANVGDIAREQRPRLAPVGPVVVQDLARALGDGDAGAVTPGRVIADAVWRIAHEQVRPRPVQSLRNRFRVRGVAAHQPMAAESPDIAQARGRVRGCLGGVIGVCQAARANREQRVQLSEVETGERQVEPDVAQFAELDPEQVVVPAGRERQTVVGQDVGLLLRWAEVGPTRSPEPRSCPASAPRAGGRGRRSPRARRR